MKKNELPRFNMPYELGLDIGCAEFGPKRYRSKKILILETERFHYQKVISDIAGQDIESHGNDAATLLRKIRNWFSTVDPLGDYPGANQVWVAYNQFYDDITDILTDKGYTDLEIENMPVADFVRFSKDWINNFRA